MATKHERTASFSIGAIDIEINGKVTSGGAVSFAAVRCSCGWASGKLASKVLADQAFEKHVRESRRRVRSVR